MTKFPIEFPTCPFCNAMNGVAQLAFQEEIEAGNPDIPRDTNKVLDIETRFLVDPTGRASAPAIIISWDICSVCGVRRVMSVKKRMVELPKIKPTKITRPPPGFRI